MHAYAWGHLGLQPREYYLLTMHEYLAICRGREQKAAILDNHFRRLAFITVNMNSERGKQLKHFSDLWEIPLIDGEKERETEADQKANFEHFQKLIKRYGKTIKVKK